MTDCRTGKVSYDTAAAAHKVMRRQEKRKARAGEPETGKTNVYTCQHCGKYHIGHAIAAKDYKRPGTKVAT